MADLRDQFRQAVRDAKESLAHFPATPETHYPSLWQAIAGPPRSGKSVLANEYADALHAAGITTAPPLYLGPGSHRVGNSFTDEFSDQFRNARGGVLIIDEPEKISERAQLYAQMIAAHDAQSCIIVITGYKDVIQKFIDDMPPELKLRWTPEVRETERPYTDAERAAYEALKAEERRTAARLAAEQQQRLAEMHKWRELPKVDVSAPQAIRAMKPVRFGPAKTK